MNQKYPKRLIEVDLPIRRISAHARREKSIRHGHISTLHIWWARRPLAACRAVICASLWPDPADPLCPQSFRDRASKIVYDFASAAVHSKELGARCDHETWIKWQVMARNPILDSHNEEHWNILRFALLDFIADFANWDNSTVKEYLGTSRALTQAAHESLGGEPGTRPLVVDPFAGGGAIPLEALRIGADAFATDLNPIPVLLNKLALEDIPKHGFQLADELRSQGTWIKREADKELSEFYPHDSDGAIPIAYLWARTIRCEGPRCGAEVPLITSLWLGRKPHNSWALTMTPNHRDNRVEFGIVRNVTTQDVGNGTVKRGAATCPCCGFTTPVTSVRDQLRARRGGARDARLVAVVTTRSGKTGRLYRLPNRADEDAVQHAAERLQELNQIPGLGLSEIPNEDLPPKGTLGFRVQNYGMLKWEDLYSPRQLLTLITIARLVRTSGEQARKKLGTQLGDVIQTLLAVSLSRLTGRVNSLCWWRSQPDQEKVEVAFTGQTVPMKWDFAEGCPLTDGTAGWDDSYEPPIRVVENLSSLQLAHGSVAQESATSHPLPNDSADAFVTDPPYYDSVPYAALSDFFFVWLKRSIPSSWGWQRNSVTPKDKECIVDEASGKTKVFFEEHMAKAMGEGRRVLKPTGIGLVVFAHKSTSGWESQLQAMVDAGWVVTGSWPIDTEMSTRLRARDSAALASSVHIVCRPRQELKLGNLDEIGDWRDILQELPQRIHEWMPRLADEGVVGADAIFACLGPALEIFSRYSRVEKANGDTVALREYLEHVWAAVAKEALAQVFKGADATGFEPDARLTAMWLWTLNAPTANGNTEDGEEEDIDEDEAAAKKPNPAGFKLEYDAARKIAQGLGAALENLTHLVELKGDEARLLPVAERTRHLFGKEQEEAARPVRKKASAQLNMFAELTEAEDTETAWQEKTVTRMGETTLDRIHQAMILFAAGRGDALKRFVIDDGVGRDSKFWRLAQALSALYPTGTDERRWVEGVMARKKQFGF